MSERHCITIAPSMKSGLPCVDGKRFPAETAAELWWSGQYYDIDDLLKEWPQLDRGGVLVACWYMARYGSWGWRKRWKDWLPVADRELWNCNYQTCPLPSQIGG